MVDTQHFCLRWNNYQSSITSAFENLRDDEDFVDVTLACDGKSLKAHRVVLSACSPYFRELLKVRYVDLRHSPRIQQYPAVLGQLLIVGILCSRNELKDFPREGSSTLKFPLCSMPPLPPLKRAVRFFFSLFYRTLNVRVGF